MTEVVKLLTARRPGNHGLWQTRGANGMMAIIEACRRGRSLGLITGPSGVGKTTAARAAVAMAQEGEHGAYLASLTRAAEGLQPGLLRLAQAVGAHVSGHLGGNDVHDAMVYHSWGRGALLVIDEAQFASDALLHAIRNLWDDLDARGRAPGIVLIGTPDLAERIKGRGAQKLRAFEPLRGRLSACIEMERPDAEDFTAIGAHVGLSGPDAVKFLARVGQEPGGLHNVRRLLEQARGAAGPEGRIGLSHLKAAAALAGVSA